MPATMIKNCWDDQPVCYGRAKDRGDRWNAGETDSVMAEWKLL